MATIETDALSDLSFEQLTDEVRRAMEGRLLSRRHHRLVHECGWTGDADGNFHHSWGQPYPTVPALPRGDPDEVVESKRELPVDSGIDALLRKIELEHRRDWGHLY
jgi:hypothetical protein